MNSVGCNSDGLDLVRGLGENLMFPFYLFLSALSMFDPFSVQNSN